MLRESVSPLFWQKLPAKGLTHGNSKSTKKSHWLADPAASTRTIRKHGLQYLFSCSFRWFFNSQKRPAILDNHRNESPLSPWTFLVSLRQRFELDAEQAGFALFLQRKTHKNSRKCPLFVQVFLNVFDIQMWTSCMSWKETLERKSQIDTRQIVTSPDSCYFSQDVTSQKAFAKRTIRRFSIWWAIDGNAENCFDLKGVFCPPIEKGFQGLVDLLVSDFPRHDPANGI